MVNPRTYGKEQPEYNFPPNITRDDLTLLQQRLVGY